MGYIIGMCRSEGYEFEAVYSGIGYINKRVVQYSRIMRFLVHFIGITRCPPNLNS